ncbi:hypothetical protein ACIOWI_31700 [Streptomyces sp. NPDC087659]|uniref:hypothetical protein n=1 Tax=Streptomyces sp. NPDC087659 TaxID=3365801 RepID=UPI00382FB405
MSTPELLSRMEKAPEFDLFKITGMAERRVADDTGDSPEDCLTMAVSAARECLGRSRYSADEIDIVISCSISRTTDGRRHQFEPSFARRIAGELGADRAIHFDVSNACAGMMTGVYLLDRMIRSGEVRNGLVLSGEHITRSPSPPRARWRTAGTLSSRHSPSVTPPSPSSSTAPPTTPTSSTTSN